MKKEINYFVIDGEYGGNQNLLKDFFMRMGGCGAVTACDSAVYLSKYKNQKLYPFDIDNLNYDDFVKFTNIMRPYLYPRITGINKLSIFIEGFNKFLKDRNVENIILEEFSGNNDFEKAKEVLKNQIDKELLVPILVLQHKSSVLKKYVWHWFVLGGYEEINGKFFVKAITEGSYNWIDLALLWDTGYEQKGGLILYDIKEN